MLLKIIWVNNIYMEKNIIKLTESDLKNIIKESVKQYMKESFDEYDYFEHQLSSYKEEKEIYKALYDYLLENNINEAKLKYNNCWLISIPTETYKQTKVKELTDSFALSKKLYADFKIYPATTYIYLRKL